MQSMTLSIHIVGLGVSEKAHLNIQAMQVLVDAQWVVASPRQLNVVADFLTQQQTKHLPRLPELLTWINSLDDESEAGQYTKIVVLASGDPLFYGIGAWFSRNFNREVIHFYPAVSSIQVACHVLGLSLQDVDVLSLHGRPFQKIRSHLKNNQTTLVLTDKHSGPYVLAKECIQAGFDHSIITVCESLGYQHQKVRSFNMAELENLNIEFDDLHITVIQTKGAGKCRPEFPGFNDEWFVTGTNNDNKTGAVMITKREVRLNILSLLQPANNDVIWDIGAGCGSVAVELAYWNNKCEVYAIEHHPDRLQCLEKNRQKFGVVTNLKIVAARAPLALAELPIPSKVFIGGSDGELTELLNIVWHVLPVGGSLVVSSVMETSKLLLVQFLQIREQKCDAISETSQIAVSKGGRLAGQLLYRPSLPVTLFKFVKQVEVEDV
jgi:precorrin-6Y C5,15-methyltransferase (decarboxylating)